jgi:hypothetical protein
VRRALAHALLFAGAAALCALTMLQGIQPNDEGLMLAAASRIASGQVPYHDFWWFYPPGQPYLLAGLWKVFGPSLLVWRIVRVAADATVVVLAYRLARRAAPRELALAAAGIAALAMAVPSGPHPFPIALAFALGALLTFEDTPLKAGMLAGACAAWRIEFAAYLGLGILIAYALAPAERARRAGRFAGAAALTAAVLYGPVVIAAGLHDAYHLLIDYPLTDFTKYQTLPFPFSYHGPLDTGSIGGFFSHSAEPLLLFYLPLAIALGFVGSLVALGAGFDRSAHWPRAATVVFGVGMGHYMLVRTDLFHTAPLVVALGVLGAWALAAPSTGRAGSDATRRATRAARLAATAGAGLAAAALAFAAVEGADRSWLALREHDRALHLPAADGVRADAHEAGDIEAAVRYVHARVPAHDPIYVATRRSDLVTSGNPLFYVLADRPNPTRYDIEAPGVVNSAPVAREIVSALRRARPRVIVRYTAPATAAHEPNRSGRSTGVRLLDLYLAAGYRPARRFGYYLMLEPRRTVGASTDPSGRRRGR